MNEKVITIDPITRLEGHGKISIFLDEHGDVENAYFQVPELRGFEKFCEGMPAEEMPQVTQRICGVCPTAHHMASTKALDSLYQVQPPPAAVKIRELVYNTFMAEDHILHFFFLGGPDFVVGPHAPKAERNILGVIQKAGIDAGKKVILYRKELRNLMTSITGKAVHPVFGLPGGISKAITPEIVDQAKKAADHAIEFCKWTNELFAQIVLGNQDYVDLVLSDIYSMKTYYMGLVDKNNQINFYDGNLRVKSPNGDEYARFHPNDYLDYIREHVEPWTYIRPTYLKDIGWQGFVDGSDSGIYRVNPMARLNVSEGLPTPLANTEYDKLYSTLGGKPVHGTLAWHWARVIEALYAAERMKELANDPEILDSNVRELPTKTPKEGIGCVEAPRGVLIHDYKTDDQGIIQKANLIVATQQNAAPICIGIEKAAKGLIHNGVVTDGLLNQVEMAFRAYDPCFACATHSLPGQLPLMIEVLNNKSEIIKKIPMWENPKEES